MLLLHDVFGYPFDEIGPMVDLSPVACRQLASRTRQKLDHERDEGRRPDEAREQELVGNLLATIASGDIDAVMRLLAPDVVLLSDGGPHRHAARRPVVGADRVARLIVNLAQRLVPGSEMRLVQVNGEPGVLFLDAEHAPDYTLSFSFTPDGPGPSASTASSTPRSSVTCTDERGLGGLGIAGSVSVGSAVGSGDDSVCDDHASAATLPPSIASAHAI